MSKERIFRREIVSRMWATGRPSNSNEFADIYAAARKANLDHGQAFALACAAYDAAQGYVEKLATPSGWLRQATLLRKAADPRFPTSLWAYMAAKLGAAYRYVTDEEIRSTQNDDWTGWCAWARAREAQLEVAS